VQIRGAWIVAAVFVAACGGGRVENTLTPAGSSGAAAAPDATDDTLAWAGTYTGEVTLPRGRYTYTWPAVVEVERAAPGILRIPVRDLCAPIDSVDIAPPDALVILIAPPGDRSFELPSGDRVTMGSIHVQFDEDGRILTVAMNGETGSGDLEWTFIGVR
jgi:hypothetical protein